MLMLMLNRMRVFDLDWGGRVMPIGFVGHYETDRRIMEGQDELHKLHNQRRRWTRSLRQCCRHVIDGFS